MLTHCNWLSFTMIRPTTEADTSGLMALAEATGLFEPSQLKDLGTLLVNYFDPNHTSQALWLTDDDHGPVGVACCEPEQMTDQTWNLRLIAVHPSYQGQGRGTALLHHVEELLVAQGGRMVVIETSGTPDFERTRRFYVGCGYQAEGRIRDFYTTGYDKVAFRKLLRG